jgi:bacteriocin-like protein
MKGVNMSKQKQRKPTKEPKTTEVATELTDDELSKVSGGTFKAFANFGDIKGESVTQDHKDWVMI